MIWSTLTVGATGTTGGGAAVELPAIDSICTCPEGVSTFATVGGAVLLGGLVETVVTGADTGTCAVTGRPTGAPLWYMPAGVGGTSTIWTAPGPAAGLSLSELEECEIATGRTGYGETSTDF